MNHLGSVTHITDKQGAVIERYSYDVYVTATILNAEYEPQTGSAVGNIYYFTGRQLDFETGSALSERLGHAALRIGSTIYHVPAPSSEVEVIRGDVKGFYRRYTNNKRCVKEYVVKNEYIYRTGGYYNIPILGSVPVERKHIKYILDFINIDINKGNNYFSCATFASSVLYYADLISSSNNLTPGILEDDIEDNIGKYTVRTHIP